MRDAEGRRRRAPAGGRTGPTRARRRSRPTCRSRARELGAAIDEAHKRGHQGDRPPLLGHLRRGRRPRHRQSRARLPRRHRLRRRQEARRVPGPGRAASRRSRRSTRTASRSRRWCKKLDRQASVALTSTLTVFETFTPGRPMPPGLDVLLPQLKEQFEQNHARTVAEQAVGLHDALSEGAGARARVRAGGRHCSSPAPIRPAAAASFPATRTSGRSSCWSRRASRRSRRSASAR